MSAFAQETAAAPDAPQTTAPKAESKGPQGFELGARLGFGLGLGSSAQGASMSDNVGTQIPIIVDIGYRITPNVYVGAYGQYGVAFDNNNLCSQGGVSCSAQSYRVGANVHYHFLPEGSFDPWIGGGVGYEILHLSATAGGQTESGTTSGFELFNFQVGGDYHLSPNASIGPFAQLSLAQYSTASQDHADGTHVSGDIQNTALHEWLTLGVKGTFDL